MKKIAITGVIASGKSTVCRIIEQLGGFVIYTDKINSDLLCDKSYIEKLKRLFPLAVQNGIVDRKKIREEIVKNDNKRELLNNLAHKEITKKVKDIINALSCEIVFCEIPLIVESGMSEYFDEIWCVVSNRETKINRIMMRDTVSKEQAEKIIDCQNEDSVLMAISDVVIENNGTDKELKEKIKTLFKNVTK